MLKKTIILALSLLLLLLLEGICDAKIFDLGNYSIDTGSYITPADVTIAPDKGIGRMVWFWSNPNERTDIIIQEFPEYVIRETEKIANIGSHSEISVYMAGFCTDSLIASALGFHYDKMTSEDYTKNVNKIRRNVTSVSTTKPYTGYISTYPDLPQKFYVGIIDDHTYLEIQTNERDEMFALLLRNIRVIPKENVQLERLNAIQKML